MSDAADRSDQSAVPLVLASASPARARILTAAGVPFSTVVSAVDEDAVAAGHPHATPEQLSLLLARAKAQDVATRSEASGAVVLGCDSVFELDGVPHGKPWEPEVALERWRQQSGRTGVLHTGHWVVDTRATAQDGQAGRTASAAVRFAPVTEQEIRAYVATGEPLQCAGAFTIDGRGAAFVEGVDGDPNAVIGLSVSTLRVLLQELGHRLTDLW